MGDICIYIMSCHGMKNVTHLKTRTLYTSMELFSVGQHLSLGAWEIVGGINNKFSDINRHFRSFDFCDFLEEHFQFFM